MGEEIQVDRDSSQIKRLNELNSKATQLLTFLSFAMVAAILLETSQVLVLTACQKVAVNWSLRFWVLSLFPILLIVLPVQEIVPRNRARWSKVILLGLAVLLVICGAIAFLCAIW